MVGSEQLTVRYTGRVPLSNVYKFLCLVKICQKPDLCCTTHQVQTPKIPAKIHTYIHIIHGGEILRLSSEAKRGWTYTYLIFYGSPHALLGNRDLKFYPYDSLGGISLVKNYNSTVVNVCNWITFYNYTYGVPCTKSKYFISETHN